jgi:hypothetical protein
MLVLDTVPHTHPGKTLGTFSDPGPWQGCPVVACSDGTVVLRFGDPAPQPPGFREGRSPQSMNRDLLRERCRTAIGL